MDIDEGREWLEEFERHLSSNEQSWLLGAGVSKPAKIPLMLPLTDRVLELFNETDAGNYEKVVKPIRESLPNSCHIEHILSHFADLIALGARTEAQKVDINGVSIDVDSMKKIHEDILTIVSNVIRYGYDSESGASGSHESSIVEIEGHTKFVRTLFKHAGAGIRRHRKPISFFTTNYDTLLEDALALERLRYWDGFSGGAVAFRETRYGDKIPMSGVDANVIKLHGSIDWYSEGQNGIWRVREVDLYPARNKRVLIYPQSKKYIETQYDPFAAQFDFFRQVLNSPNNNVLCLCGYSFGDDHINTEISVAMENPDNRTTLLIFTEQKEPEGVLKEWLESSFSKKIFIATPKGLYTNGEGPIARKNGDDDWWTFSGVTDLLENGWEA